MNRKNLIAPYHYNIIMEIEKHLNDHDKLALIYLNETGHRREITYKELIQNVNRIGHVLLNSGLKKGDKVLITVPLIIEAYEVYLAALKTGIIIVPSSEMLRTSDLQYRVTHGEVDGIISYYPYVDSFKDIREFSQLKKFVIGEEVTGWQYLDQLKTEASDQLETRGSTKDDIAFLPYTSGTTGNPKGVVHAHSWGYAHLRTVAENWLDITKDDVVWATASPGWQKWVWSPFLSVLGSGATGFIYDGRFNAEKYLSLLQNEKINVLCCTPTEYRMMIQVEKLASYHLDALRSAVSAGEPLNREVIETFKNTFNISVRDGYGQTESTLLLGIMKDMEIKLGSMGKPTPGNEIHIIDQDGQPVEIGVTGDIALKLNSPALYKKYYKDELRTKQAKRGDYFITGDQAYQDEDGYFWFAGRNDDIIISSGYTIGPFEIEDVLTKHPAVKECAVVGSPDPVRGQVVKAFIVTRENYEYDHDELIEELQQFVKNETAPYKYPRKIEFIDELPKTISGKIRHIELRERELKKQEVTSEDSR